MQDWDDLRFFVALADEGSLSAVARRLNVDHATVARRIAALEERAGARLVDRRPRRYLLTEKGRQVAEHARRIEAEVFAIERELMEAGEERPVEIAVSAPPAVATMLIAPKLADFRARHPLIRLLLLSDARAASLSRREADIAVRIGRPEDSTLVIRKAGTVRYRPYASRDYLRGHEPAGYGFIFFDGPLQEAPHQVWFRAFAQERPVVLRTNDLAVQAAAAAADAGIAMLPDFLAAGLDLERAGGEDDLVSREVYITYHGDLRQNLSVAAVATFLAGCFRSL